MRTAWWTHRFCEELLAVHATGQISGIIVNNGMTFILGETTGTPAVPTQWPILRESCHSGSLTLLNFHPWSLFGQGLLRALTGTLCPAVGDTNCQNIKKTREKESEKSYRETEQRGSSCVSVGTSLSCTWVCKLLTLALLWWPGLTPDKPGHKGAATKARG